MSLGRWIRDVLDYRSEVAVPGIGVFKKTHFPASYYAKEQVFLPPYDQIDLVAEGDHTLNLVNYLQIHYQLDSVDADARLENELNEVFTRLNEGKTVYLEGLGQLENDRSVLKFSPLETDKLGFGTVAEWPGIASAVPVQENLSTEQPSNNRNWLLVMGLFLIAAVIGGIWFLYEPSGTAIPGQRAGVEPSQEEQEQHAVPVGSDSTEASEPLAEVAQVVDNAEDAALRGNVLDPETGLPGTTFEIIVGTFQTIDEAAEYMQKLKNQGFGQVRILAMGPGSRLHKVSWGAYATMQDAQAVLRNVQQRIESGAWVDRINR